MTSPRIICPLCATASALHPSTALLAVTPHWSTITFVCDTCGAVSARSLNPRVHPALEAAGFVAVGLPQSHPEHPVTVAPALTPDDLLDLHVLLQEDGWFARLAQGVIV